MTFLCPGSFYESINCDNRISDAVISVLALSAVNCGFEPWSGQTKDNKIGIYHFSSKHTALRSKRKVWLARYQDNVSEWNDIFTH